MIMQTITVSQASRRNLLKRTIRSLSYLALSLFCPNLQAKQWHEGMEDRTHSSGNATKFGREFFVDRINETTWSIRARVDAPPNGENEIPFVIEIATDESFSQIIKKLNVKGKRERGFMVWIRYENYLPNALLYIRCTMEGKRVEKNLLGADTLITSVVKQMHPLEN